MRPSKHESVKPKSIKILTLRRSVAADSGERKRYYLDAGFWRYRCSIGRCGVTRRKREGDGCTPVGRFAILAWLLRPAGTVAQRPTAGWRMIRTDDGWCDDPRSGVYNRPIRLPSKLRHEMLWRPDSKYDAIGIMDYNIRPCRAGTGSAIFFHLCGEYFESTAGCVAVTAHTMNIIINKFSNKTKIVVF